MDHFLRPGLRFDVVDSGPVDAPAVVLLHGFPQQPSTFDAVAARLNLEVSRRPLVGGPPRGRGLRRCRSAEP